MTDEMIKRVQENSDKVFFPNLGNDNIFTNGIEIDRVLFTIPGTDIAIYKYGFLIALGILLAMIYSFRKMRASGLDSNRVIDCVIGGVIGAAIGARLYFVVFNWDVYKNDLKSILDYRDGGLAIYGGLIGAALVGCIIAKIRKVNIPALFDLVGIGFLIGQGIGRWGNFFNQEAYGTVTTAPWGMTSNKIMRELSEYAVDNVEKFPTIEAGDMIAHPCFLYESIWCLLGVLVLHLYFKHRKFDGEVFLMYLGWYGAGRFFIEGLRTDSLYIGGNLRVSQLVAAICVIAVAVLIPVIRGKVKRAGDYKFYYETDESKELLAQADALEAEARNKKNKKSEEKSENSDSVIDEAIEETQDDKQEQAEPVDDNLNDEIDEEEMGDE